MAASEDYCDTMQLSVCHGDMKFYFITKSGAADDASKDMLYSYEAIGEFSSSTEHLQWISEEECLRLPAASLTKQNIFILDEFEGKAFDHLLSTKAIVLGPRCVLTCQLTNEVVPNIASPIYTLAMKNVVACVSGLNSEKRSEIHKLIGFMGGLWTTDLTESNTHLITNTIMSIKYEKAAIQKIKIMKDDWVYDVWKISKTEDTSYTTDDFYNKYKLPIFHKLCITSTGIPSKEKNEIEKLINENGGTYTGSFKSVGTDILISQPNQKHSEKFKAAVKCRKECLMVGWIRDSVSKGYALPFINYRIYTGKPCANKILNSTPILESTITTGDFHSNSTQLSCVVSDLSIAESTVAKDSPRLLQIKANKHKGVLETIEMGQVKKAAGCLDGFMIWLCGFEAKENEILKKIINIVGAIRFDEHDSKVDYVIVGKPNSSEVSILKPLITTTNIVTVDWLVASINSKSVADAKEFAYHLGPHISDESQTIPSPASRKNIESMRPLRRCNVVPKRLNLDDDIESNEKKRLKLDNEQTTNENENNLLAQYSQPAPSNVTMRREPGSLNTDTNAETDSESIDVNLFKNRTFAIFGFSEESSYELRLEIEESGGMVEDNDSSKIVDYLIVTGDTCSLEGVNHKAKEIVNELWIQECFASNKVAEIMYYHRAILVDEDVKPLQGSHIVFSNYTSSEREYLVFLAEALGGKVNDRYMRKDRPILVCSKPDGQKYNGAIKWNLPVVTCAWLLKCHELKKNVPLREYLVGEAKWDDINMKNSTQNENVRNISSDRSDKSDKSNRSDRSEKSVKSVRTDKTDKDDKEDSIVNVVNEIEPHVSDVILEANITPARHPRVAILNTNRQIMSPLSQTPVTPVDSIAKYVEDETPKTRAFCYNVLKSFEDNESPASKLRRLENVTNSPIDMSVLNATNIFDLIDKKTESLRNMPKTPQSTPLNEYRKRMYIKILGDQYNGSPLSSRYSNEESVEEKQQNDEPSKDEATTSVSTQVQNFGDFIKKNKEDRKSIVQRQMPLLTANNDGEELLCTNILSQADINSENNQELVGWRDPDEFFQSERFFGDRSTFKGKMCFSISIAEDADMDVLRQRIVALNGTLCADILAFDPSCTHLICSKLNQSEKTLSVIAAGRWLLYIDYIEDSFNAGHFLNEENYEWGNPRAESKLPANIGEKLRSLASVSHKRRKELQLRSKLENKPVGLFSSFRVILHSARKESFKRLLEAGCGVVVDIKEPYSKQNDFQGVTHCIVDKKFKTMSNLDRAAFEKAGVPCVNILYLQECIKSETLPPVEDFLIK